MFCVCLYDIKGEVWTAYGNLEEQLFQSSNRPVSVTVVSINYSG